MNTQGFAKSCNLKRSLELDGTTGGRERFVSTKLKSAMAWLAPGVCFEEDTHAYSSGIFP